MAPEQRQKHRSRQAISHFHPVKRGNCRSAAGSAYDIVPALHAEEAAMTHTRPFDPALFREAAIDAETFQRSGPRMAPRLGAQQQPHAIFMPARCARPREPIFSILRA
jgi:hypothetical protein